MSFTARRQPDRREQAALGQGRPELLPTADGEMAVRQSVGTHVSLAIMQPFHFLPLYTHHTSSQRATSAPVWPQAGQIPDSKRRPRVALPPGGQLQPPGDLSRHT